MKTLLITLTLLIAPAFALGAGQLRLLWNDNSENELGFEVERRLAVADAQWAVIAQVPTDAEEYLDTSAELMTPYVYRVWAYNAKGRSTTSSNTATATATSDVPKDVPAAPSDTEAQEPKPYEPKLTQIGFINFSTATIASNRP